MTCTTATTTEQTDVLLASASNGTLGDSISTFLVDVIVVKMAKVERLQKMDGCLDFADAEEHSCHSGCNMHNETTLLTVATSAVCLPRLVALHDVNLFQSNPTLSIRFRGQLDAAAVLIPMQPHRKSGSTVPQ